MDAPKSPFTLTCKCFCPTETKIRQIDGNYLHVGLMFSRESAYYCVKHSHKKIMLVFPCFYMTIICRGNLIFKRPEDKISPEETPPELTWGILPASDQSNQTFQTFSVKEAAVCTSWCWDQPVSSAVTSSLALISLQCKSPSAASCLRPLWSPFKIKVPRRKQRLKDCLMLFSK